MRYEVKIGVLKNDMHFYSQYDGTTHLAGVGVKCGSIHDPPNASGLFHVVEHVLSRECMKYDCVEVDRLIERYGGGPGGKGINIRINRASTFYGFDSLLRERSMYVFFDVMANLLRDRIVTQRGLEVEGAAIHNEFHVFGKDSVPELVDDLMHETMYEKNPARNRIDCRVEDLLKISAGQVRRAIKRNYVPENMFVVMFGPKHEKVRELTQEYFGDLKSRPAPEFKYDHSESLPFLREVKSTQIVKGIRQYHYGIGFPTETYISEDVEALDVLARIWAWRSRDILRGGNRNFNKGVYRALGETERSFAHGLIYIWYASVSKEFAMQGEQVVLTEAKRLREELIRDWELDAIVGNLYEEEYLDAFQRTPLNLAEKVIEAICNGDEELVRLHTFGKRLRKVTRKKLREVANKYFTPNYVRVIVGPEPVDN